MLVEFVILSLVILSVSLTTWMIASKKYEKDITSLKEENIKLKNQTTFNENFINQLKLEFVQIAENSLKKQHDSLISEHSSNLKEKLELFQAEQISPINKLLTEFKTSIDKYQEAHKLDSIEIKNAISTAEKYAKALTTNQNSKGEFGEDLLEQILNFADLKENLHYTKQYNTQDAKPDFVINLPDNKHLIIDSKVILKNYIEYRQTNSDSDKKQFLSDLTNCINSLGKKNYQDIPQLNQPGFILMYIPIEGCIDLIYTDSDFKKILINAINQNIIIIGSASLLVTLKLVIKIWNHQKQHDNVQNIINTAQNLYNNIAEHAQNIIKLREILENSLEGINKEINRFTTRHNGSIFREAEKLKQYGIQTKEIKTGKTFSQKEIPQEFI